LRKSGVDKPEGRQGSVPESLAYVWVWFCELTFTDFSPMQIQAFFALEQVELKTWEYNLLKRLWREWKSGSS